MTFKTNQLRDAIKFALAIGASAAVGTSTVFAQEQTAEPSTLDRIEVTGSRIKRVDIETSQPIFQLSREDIQAQGLTSIGDVIQNLATSGSTLNTTFNNGGNGETQVDLRNLGGTSGAARTLVLVNGRRWVGGTGLGGGVDLNTIPTAMVERIEVLKDGASVIYGSDAIAGVVNIILRDEFEGAEANAYIGQFDKGDGTRESYDFTIGTVADRFSAMLGISYVKEEPVFAGDREVSKDVIAGTGAALASTTTPNGRFGLCTGSFDSINGVCSVRETLPDGTTTLPPAGLPSFTYDGFDPDLSTDDNALNWRPRVGTDSFNTAPTNYLLTPQERISLFASGKLDITDNLRFKVTASYNERKSEQQLATIPITLGSSPGASPNARAITISEDSIFNPFGEEVTRIQRRPVEAGPRLFTQDVDTFATNLGFEGDFEIGERYFSWEAGYFYGKNENTQTTTGQFNLVALRDGLGPSFRDADGVARCGTPDNILVGCVPINFLGGVGSLTPEMLAFASAVLIDQFEYEQKNLYANISGEIVDLPAGPLAFAFGLENRRESGFDQPDPISANGNSTGNNRTATRGSFDLDEAFLELAIPILADVPGAQLLDVNLATRMSDYSNFGQTTNSKFGFRWKPIEDLLVRGNYTEGFRAPSIDELFSGVSDNFPLIGDPCSTTFGGGFNQLTPEQQARCFAQGVPAGGYDQGNAQIRISTGGNVDLEPETATTKTLGFVYSPAWAEGLDISLDWWNIEIENTIGQFTGQQILDFCIEDGVQSFCDIITRAPGGAISTLLSTTVNIGSTEVEGYDLTVGYRLPEYDWGRISFTWDSTYMSSYEEDLDGDGIRGEEVGDGGGNQVGEYQGNNVGANRWRIRSNLTTRWELGDFGATWNVRYYSSQEEGCPFYYNDYGFGELCSDAILGPGPLGGVDVVQLGSQNHIGSATYHDVSGYWNTPWNAKVTIGINNVLDKNPPLAFTTFANTFDPQYEIPGRFYYLSYTQKF